MALEEISLVVNSSSPELSTCCFFSYSFSGWNRHFHCI